VDSYDFERVMAEQGDENAIKAFSLRPPLRQRKKRRKEKKNEETDVEKVLARLEKKK
jgi:hypothetical protein